MNGSDGKQGKKPMTEKGSAQWVCCGKTSTRAITLAVVRIGRLQQGSQERLRRQQAEGIVASLWGMKCGSSFCSEEVNCCQRKHQQKRNWDTTGCAQVVVGGVSCFYHFLCVL